VWITALGLLGGLYLIFSRDTETPDLPVSVATSTESGGEQPPMVSGIEGVVLVGPTCPVERMPPDPACADKPYATAILVYRTGTKKPFIIGNSTSDGTFKFSLPPGSYTLAAKSGAMLPYCSEVSTVVVAEEYTSVDISCDSGIR